MDKMFWLNVFDRVGWTFAQALGGTVAAASATATIGTFDWRSALAGAATAAALCALKVLGVHTAQLAGTGRRAANPPVAAPAAEVVTAANKPADAPVAAVGAAPLT